MTRIGVTASSEIEALPYVEATQCWDAEIDLLLPTAKRLPTEQVRRLDGLLITGGEDISPRLYDQEIDPLAGVHVNEPRDSMEFPIVQAALDRDIPILGICRGLQTLNVSLGGSLIQDLPGHKELGETLQSESAFHRIWISPGSKLAAVLGSGGRVRVNSRHHQGLREAQKSSQLIASAYSVEDSIIEALESPKHHWVIGIQCHPERLKEVPRQFQRLFQMFVSEAKGDRRI